MQASPSIWLCSVRTCAARQYACLTVPSTYLAVLSSHPPSGCDEHRLVSYNDSPLPRAAPSVALSTAGYEHRLLVNYNDKPLLTRPQQRFYRGNGYLGGWPATWLKGWQPMHAGAAVRPVCCCCQGEWTSQGPPLLPSSRLLPSFCLSFFLTTELDLDVHNYAYIARRAFHGFLGRLAPVVFENAFVVQGGLAG